MIILFSCFFNISLVYFMAKIVSIHLCVVKGLHRMNFSTFRCGNIKENSIILLSQQLV